MARSKIKTGGKPAFVEHELRAAVLAELHARPFTPIETPTRILHFGFVTGRSEAEADRVALKGLCTQRGMKVPGEETRHHRCSYDGVTLRWESHAEFSTYTWELAAKPGAKPFDPPTEAGATPMADVPQPGPLLVAIDLHLVSGDAKAAPEDLFDRASLARAEVMEGAAEIATDFRVDDAGFVRILVINRELDNESAGALVQRVLEIETYRTLALLGLPAAHKLAPIVNRIESELANLTAQMRESEELDINQKLLVSLTDYAAELEAGAAAALFRFGASRAYDEIVHGRLRAVGEQPVQRYPTWSQFLMRRMAPAMRTCIGMEERQANLSRKLARAAQLLRTRVEIALEQQNRNLLEAMNRRAHLQLRLQQTVEGLSVAAISYYTVGLINYLLKGAYDAGIPVDPTIGTAVSVPVVVIGVALIVRRIRRRYDMRGKDADE
jgi:uncharacterized membrane-anchored protein